MNASPIWRSWKLGADGEAMAPLVPRLAHTAALIFAFPAHAQDAAFWDATGCTLVPVTGEAWVAQLECVNFLTNMTPADVSAVLHIDGLAVRLDLAQTFGRTPDVFTVTPPEGFVAVPPVLVLDEEARGVVRVMEYLGF